MGKGKKVKIKYDHCTNEFQGNYFRSSDSISSDFKRSVNLIKANHLILLIFGFVWS